MRYNRMAGNVGRIHADCGANYKRRAAAVEAARGGFPRTAMTLQYGVTMMLRCWKVQVAAAFTRYIAVTVVGRLLSPVSM